MKKIILFFYVLLILSFVSFSNTYNDPRIMFSDLISGPDSGWSAETPDSGCAVSIWGINLGLSRGSSYVTVNGAVLNNNSDYAEWGVYEPTPNLQRITFWLNPECNAGLGNITVTVGGQTSNALPFTVRDGDIKFVDKDNGSAGDGSFSNPWQSPQSFIGSRSAGEICYVREGTYDQSYDGGPNIYFKNAGNNGTESEPIAFVAYPGETVIFDSRSLTGDPNNFIVESSWITLSKFECLSDKYNIFVYDINCRVIGLDVLGCTVSGGGSAMITTGPADALTESGLICYGCYFHGATNKTMTDHVIYTTGYPTGGVDFGWNYVYDCDFDRGNILQLYCYYGAEDILGDFYIHNNVVFAESTALYVIDVALKYDGNQPASNNVYVYNNLIIGGRGGLSAQTSHCEFVNNTIYHSDSDGVSWQSSIKSLNINNNIINMKSTSNKYFRTGSYSTAIMASVSNNLYYGIGSYSGVFFGEPSDANAVNADPLFINPGLVNFKLSSSSPAIDAGTSSLAPILDFDRSSRPRGSAYDIGAYEHLLSWYFVDTTKNGYSIFIDRSSDDDSAWVYSVVDGDTVFADSAKRDTFNITGSCFGTENVVFSRFLDFDVVDTINTLDLTMPDIRFYRDSATNSFVNIRLYANPSDSCNKVYKGNSITELNIDAYYINSNGDTISKSISGPLTQIGNSGIWSLPLSVEETSTPNGNIIFFTIDGNEIYQTRKYIMKLR